MAPSEEKAIANFGCDQRYNVQQFLGQGSYGTVCSATDQMNGEMVAIKKMTNVFSHVAETKRTLRELRLLRHFCNHENVLTIHNVLPPEGGDVGNFSDIFIVTEMMDTDLDQVIRSPQQLTELHVQTFLYQILRGLQYVHGAHVIHRDLKPGNILVNQNCTVKICDFGLARLEPETGYGGFMTEYVVTRWYRAPEIMLSGQDYTQSIDVWSVGCILAEMLGRQPVFPGKNYVDQVRVIVDILGTPTEAGLMMIEDLEAREYVKSLPVKGKPDWRQRYPQGGDLAADLLDKLLKFDPNERCTVEEALNHPYLAGIRAEDNDVFGTCAPFKFDFENTDLSSMECRQLVVEEINYYEKQDAEREREAMMEAQEAQGPGAVTDAWGVIPEGEEMIPFGQDSLKFGQFAEMQQQQMEQQYGQYGEYEENPHMQHQPQPPEAQIKYNSMLMRQQRVIMGEDEETGWGTRMLTPVTEEREEELAKQRREDEALAAAERAAERAAEKEREAREEMLRRQRERPSRDLAHSAGHRVDHTQYYAGTENRPIQGSLRARDPSPSGRRAVSAGKSRDAATRTKRDSSPAGRNGRTLSAGGVRAGSASRSRPAGAPPAMPKNSGGGNGPSRQTTSGGYSRTVYQAGNVTKNGSGKSKNARPSSAPNSKPRTGVAHATTASSLSKRRAQQSSLNPGDAAGDVGKSALQELLKTYKGKAERELSGGGVRKPLKARYI